MHTSPQEGTYKNVLATPVKDSVLHVILCTICTAESSLNVLLVQVINACVTVTDCCAMCIFYKCYACI